MATQHEIIEALKQRGLAYDQPGELQQFSGAYRKLPAVNKADVFWYVRGEHDDGGTNAPKVRRGKTLATSVPVDLEQVLRPLLDSAQASAMPTRDFGVVAGPDVIALLHALRDVVRLYWGAADAGRRPEHAPPAEVARANDLLERYAGLLPPET